jgi:hypothetical protein
MVEPNAECCFLPEPSGSFAQPYIGVNAAGPFFPLLQPTQVFVSTKDLKNAFFNAQYQVDVTQVSPK